MKQKMFKKILTTALAVGLLFTTSVTSEAAKTTKATTISPLSEYSYSSGISNSGAIYVQLDEPGDYITNIKSKNSNLKAKLTRAYTYHYKTDYYTSSNNTNYAVIGLYGKKALSTTVTFDIYGENNKKKESKSVKVNVKTSSYTNPVKSIKFAGKPLDSTKLYTAKSGKLKVTLNKKYKLLKVETGTYTAPVKSTSYNTTYYENEMVYKQIKNNSKITLGKYGYYYSYNHLYSDGDRHSYYSTRILAPTEIRITYQNKKTKTTGTVTYTMNKLIK